MLRSVRTSALVLLAYLGGTLSVAEAGTSTPDLQPEPSVFATPQLLLDYHLAVRKALSAEVATSAPFAALVLPSFSSEWLLVIHDPQNEFARIELRVVDGQVWGATQLGEALPDAAIQTGLIDAAVAQEVIAASERALRRTRVPPPQTSFGLDGTSYHFSGFVRGAGNLSGHVWSPDPNTNTGRLVGLVNKLRRYVETPKEDGPANEGDIKALALKIAPKADSPPADQP